MGDALVYDIKSVPLTQAEVLHYISNIQLEKISKVPAVRPKGSEVYIYTWDCESKKDNWCADQHRWINNGRKKYPKQNPVFYKTYYFLENENGVNKNFSRHVYIPIDTSVKYICVHYIGDETLSIPFPHRSQKSQNRNYIRTAPSVLKDIENSTKEPALAYKNFITGSDVDSQHMPVLLPRNVWQVRNGQRTERQKKRLTHDDMYNLHELYFQIPRLIWKLELLPDLVCVVGQGEMFNEMKNALQLSCDSSRQLLSYDTTFDMGDYYVSVLSMRHVLFESSPVVPLAFLIHERKFETAHKAFFEILAHEIPFLKRADFPIVLDREINMTKAVQSVFPDLKIVYCWNHIKRDAKFWLRSHNATSDEISVYMTDLSDILACEDNEELEDVIATRQPKWSQAWNDYFAEHLESDIRFNASKKVLLDCGIFNPYNGITNNQAESVNAMVKRVNEWKQMPLDGVVLAFNFLQTYLRAEFLRGRCDMGDFIVRKEFQDAKLEADEVDFPKCVVNPDELLDKIRNSVKEECVGIVGSDIENRESETQLDNRFQTQTVLAKDAVSSKKVHHCAQSGAFIVEGHTNKYAVTLFPRETCQCPSTITCSHIIAARISIGMHIQREKSVINLTRLRRNSRKRRDKKSGKKQPRPSDYEVVPAPDSSFCMSNTSVNIPLSECETSTPLKSKRRIHFGESGDVCTPLKPRIHNLGEENAETLCTLSKSILKRASKEKVDIVSRIQSQFTSDELNTLFEKLEDVQFHLPSVTEYSSDDPTFSFYRECLQIFEPEIDHLSETLPKHFLKVTQHESQSIKSQKLLLLSSILCKSVSSGSNAVHIIETLFKIPGQRGEIKDIKRSFRSKCHLKILNNDIGPDDILTLDNDNWVNDKIIHAYLGLRMKEINERGDGMRFLILPCFLHQMWERSDFQSWLFKKITFSSRKLLMPINLRSQHWILLFADTIQKEVSVIDSNPNPTSKQSIINHWIKFMEIRGDTNDEHLKSGWVEREMLSSKQSDGTSCGIFTIMNADALLQGLPVCIMRQCHVKNYRVYVRQKLLNSAVPNKEKICELPFCTVPEGKHFWIQCEACNRWFHWQCLGLKSEPQNFVCLSCL